MLVHHESATSPWLSVIQQRFNEACSTCAQEEGQTWGRFLDYMPTTVGMRSVRLYLATFDCYCPANVRR
jgi:hypothetical protein